MSDPAVPASTEPENESDVDQTETETETETQPSTVDMQEPSTEKEPGDEPKAPEKRVEPEPSHEAVGIGIIGRPQVEPEVADSNEADSNEADSNE